MEHIITLHTTNGDVTTSLPIHMREQALGIVMQYLADGKSFSYKLA